MLPKLYVDSTDSTECLESTLGPASPIIDFNLFKIRLNM